MVELQLSNDCLKNSGKEFAICKGLMIVVLFKTLDI